MWEAIREYLTFTRKERLGVLFLLAVIILLFILPYFFRAQPGEQDPKTYENVKEGLKKFETNHADSVRNAEDYRDHSTREPGLTLNKSKLKISGQLFFFDPNTLSADGWQKLGLTDHFAQTVGHFKSKGGHFYKPEDLKKIYGLHVEEFERLLPYIRINDISKATVKQTFFNSVSGDESFRHISKALHYTNINQADSEQWSSLPGIGATLASRIVHFRERLGGFYTIDQVRETFGLPDSTFQKIKPVLLLNPGPLVQLDLNNTSRDSLQVHPYIRWRLAKAITEYRKQHGQFHSVDDLMQIALLDSENFKRIKPYLTVNP
jgi:competence ComEA-like helix-hairpin-helix protein